MGVMDTGGTECLYDTEKTSDEPPQLIIEHIQYPVDGGGFSRGENYRKDGGSSIWESSISHECRWKLSHSL